MTSNRPLPTPRGSHAQFLDEGTWIEAEEFAYHRSYERRAYVYVADKGKNMVVRCGIADTFFSIPARASDGRKGFVSSEYVNEADVHDQRHRFIFTPYVGDK